MNCPANKRGKFAERINTIIIVVQSFQISVNQTPARWLCCHLCGANFSTAEGIAIHFSNHFASGKCVTCDQQLIDIGGEVYHLQLGRSCLANQSNQPSNTTNDLSPAEIFVKAEPLRGVDEKYLASNDEPNSNKCQNEIPITCFLQVKMESIVDCESEDSNSNARTHECYLCKMKLDSLPELQVHYRKHCDSKQCKEFPCPFCGRVFSRKGILDEHLVVHTKIKKFKCHVCDKALVRNRTLRLHLRKIHGIIMGRASRPKQTEFKCSVCNKQFKREQSLQEHMIVHSGIRNFKCNVCGKDFGRKSSMRGHIQKIHGMRIDNPERKKQERRDPRTYQCYICKRIINVFPNLLKHLALHDRSLTCETCNVTCMSWQQLVVHRKIHTETGGRDYICTECGKSYRSRSSLKEHMDKHIGYKKFICDVCGKAFNRMNTLKVHRRIHANVDEDSDDNKSKPRKVNPITYQCYMCKKFLCNIQNLLTHVANHDRSLSCDICAKSFSTWSSMVTHKKRHTDPKQFMCTYCGNSYHTNNELMIHNNSHTGLRPFKCTECDKDFARESTLRAHKRIHTGEKPNVCKIEGCGRAYMYSIDLKRHLYGAHGIYHKKYECKVCGKVLSENKLLVAHMRTH